MKPVSFDDAVRPPQHVLVRELDGESVLLNLDTETYFGLDTVGTRMWAALTTAPSLGSAFEALRAEYEVAPETLRLDLEALVAELMEKGLLERTDGSAERA